MMHPPQLSPAIKGHERSHDILTGAHYLTRPPVECKHDIIVLVVKVLVEGFRESQQHILTPYLKKMTH